MQDSAFADVLADLNQKHGQMRMSATLLIASAVLAVLVSASIGAGAVGIFLLVPIAWAVGAWFDHSSASQCCFMMLRTMRSGGSPRSAQPLMRWRVVREMAYRGGKSRP
jgi:hypothetical protein